MPITKDSIKGEEALTPKKERAPRAAKADVSAKADDSGDNFWQLDDDAEAPELVLSVGGTNYEFRKSARVNLPAGQSPDHPNVHKVE
jgi:hypothetical protein